ncbi:MAG: glycosyl transferase family 2 [Candidatus Aquiluna sp. XM-24bin5]|nr:MAG: glycosyl transferase family 2 [Candidatus Aquiluna sp. XM-24bin5]
MSTRTKAGISFVMPVRNEEKYLDEAVRAVLQQEFKGDTELVLAIGPSHDKTAEVAQGLTKTYPQLKVVDNPGGDTATGLNLAIAESKYKLVIRVDAHSTLPAGYAQLAHQILAETNAANVGGKMVAEGKTEFQRAVAYGYNNRIGLGGGAFHVGTKAGEADSVYLGCFQRSWLDKVGGFDPRWVRGQDWELNKRLREAGGKIWFDPRLTVTYYPRSSWQALAKQFFSTGVWRGALTREAPGESAARYWAPPMLVLASLFGLPFTLYLLVIAFAAMNAGELKPATRLWLMIVLPTMHFAWGLGFWWGLARGAK